LHFGNSEVPIGIESSKEFNWRTLRKFLILKIANNNACRSTSWQSKHQEQGRRNKANENAIDRSGGSKNTRNHPDSYPARIFMGRGT